MGLAKFPVTKDLDRFDFNSSPVDEVHIHSLLEGRFLAEHGNVILVGGGSKKQQSKEIDTGKALLRGYLNATAALPIIANELKLNEKSLRRMLGPAGNPTLKNFINILTACSRIEHLQLHVCQH